MAQTNVKAATSGGGSLFNGMRGLGTKTPRPVAQMMRDTTTGALAGRRVSLVETKDDIRRVWMRSAALAQDLTQNNGRLKGAVEQTLGDTVGDELKLSPAPRLESLGWTPDEISDWKKLVKEKWQEWSWEPTECDYRGKLTVPQMVDVALRYNFSFGENLSILDYFSPSLRKRYGTQTGTKVLLLPPTRLVQETREATGLFQGVLHDENGRATHYRIKDSDRTRTRDYPAYVNGRRSVLHIFDPEGADDVRGISKLASCFKTLVRQDTLSDVTLDQAIAQAAVAMVLTSNLPSPEAFEAFQELGGNEVGPDGKPAPNGYASLGNEIMGYLADAYAAVKDAGGIRFGQGPMLPHLAPGESFDFKTASVPGNNYIPFSADLRREVAAAIGVTYSSYSNDYSNATYSSVRMEVASIWPRVIRRRERIAAPLCQAIYEAWLDEQIGMGRIWFKGGYAAFRAYRGAAVWAQWKGPAPPTADDFKAARAANERVQGGTSSLEIECSAVGLDGDEVRAMRIAEHKAYSDDPMPSPYAPRASQPAGGEGSSASPDTPDKEVDA
ncbi:phage portal protein, lambda family [Cohaesibacter sp. ES.047]|uniref:phage portal protein n=1 Tax=Cohaesibacter sp. ES.047 TaxID=1798205 RepID=UPI000BB6F06C|nr:phage portal protein [Cohaesibacter sp. ES.047]SNY94071.1 phage portal protein, lambda family [Cohaesibacter sp. ES.047]